MHNDEFKDAIILLPVDVSNTPDTDVSVHLQVHLALLDYCHRMGQVKI